jgi:hypothetical protein
MPTRGLVLFSQLMMLRYARTDIAARDFNHKIEYPKWNAI